MRYQGAVRIPRNKEQKMVRNLEIAAVAATMVLLGACASEHVEPAATPGRQRGWKPAPPLDSNTSNIQVDPRIAERCQLPRAHFAFDSARVRGTDSASLEKLAACFTTGPLKGRSMSIVGHADPRGELEYNLALGQRRAGSIAVYLAKHGMSESRIITSSRGELEASGTSEETWAHDRRVEVLLAD
jgi:peptidoglycan-associated lipoprotein